MATTTKIYRREPYSLISPSNPANNHAGKTVLINGSTAGIGFAIAQAFVQANASKVILTGRGPEGLESAAAKLASITSATTIQTFVCDLSLESSVENLWQRLKLEDIRVDILVLNAADTGSGSMLPVKNFMSKMQGAFKTNVWGNMTMASRFLDQAIDEGQAKQKILINIASFMAHSNPAPFQAAYSTSKAAFAHTMQLLADEVPEDECQIINVHPGAILTEAAQKELPQEAKDAVAWDNIALPAAFAVWASTKQAAFLHGRFVWANWDMEELVNRRTEFKDPGFLKLGLQGSEYIDIRTIFNKVRS